MRTSNIPLPHCCSSVEGEQRMYMLSLLARQRMCGATACPVQAPAGAQPHSPKPEAPSKRLRTQPMRPAAQTRRHRAWANVECPR